LSRRKEPQPTSAHPLGTGGGPENLEKTKMEGGTVGSRLTDFTCETFEYGWKGVRGGDPAPKRGGTGGVRRRSPVGKRAGNNTSGIESASPSIKTTKTWGALRIKINVFGKLQQDRKRIRKDPTEPGLRPKPPKKQKGIFWNLHQEVRNREGGRFQTGPGTGGGGSPQRLSARKKTLRRVGGGNEGGVAAWKTVSGLAK